MLVLLLFEDEGKGGKCALYLCVDVGLSCVSSSSLRVREVMQPPTGAVFSIPKYILGLTRFVLTDL